MKRLPIAALSACLFLAGCSAASKSMSLSNPFKSDKQRLAEAVKDDPFPTASQSHCPVPAGLASSKK